MKDVIFVGGGLANTLAAYQLLRHNPKLQILILEKEQTLGGNHTWSFHKSDIEDQDWVWLEPFVTKTWNAYTVNFPKYSRTLSGPYASMTSEDFHQKFYPLLAAQVRLKSTVTDINSQMVKLDTGEVLEAKLVVDARALSTDEPKGYQKFVGVEFELNSDCHLQVPLLMDATVPQQDGYRFLYTLPFDKRKILIEDTYYSLSPDLETSAIEADILTYAKKMGHDVKRALRKEIGVLPLPLIGKCPAQKNSVMSLGLQSGLYHATTGYSLPFAVTTARKFAENFRPHDLAYTYRWWHTHCSEHWQKQSYYRVLNRMMFLATQPEKRYKVLEKFYQQPEETVKRFYAGKTNLIDKMRIFSGKPPVPVHRALSSLFSSGANPL